MSVPTQNTESTPNNVVTKSQKSPAKPFKLWQDIQSHQEVRIEIVPMIDVIFLYFDIFHFGGGGFFSSTSD